MGLLWSATANEVSCNQQFNVLTQLHHPITYDSSQLSAQQNSLFKNLRQNVYARLQNRENPSTIPKFGSGSYRTYITKIIHHNLSIS